MTKIFLLALMFTLTSANFSFAEPAQLNAEVRTAQLDAEVQTAQLNEAEIRLACAICSLGASDDESYLPRSMLTARGWTIEKIPRRNNRTDAKAYLVSRGDVKILAVAGTDGLKYGDADFRGGRVHLNDNVTLDAEDKNSRNEPFVQRGLRDYADEVLSDGLAEFLKSDLQKNPRATLYLTGHSLNGSVATIAAIRLADSGVDRSRLKVIAFGAAAFGSQALARAYEDRLDVTRITLGSDAVKKSLRALGYANFGKALKYRQGRTSEHGKHEMAAYLDCALRDYFNAGGDLKHAAQDKISTPIYVAPLAIVKGSLTKPDEKIIPTLLNDGLTNHFSNLTFAPTPKVDLKAKNILDEDFDKFIAEGKSRGCKYVLVRVLNAKKIRDAPAGDRLVTIEEIIFDANGAILNMKTVGASTENLTLLEAVLAAQENLLADTKTFFGTK